MASIKLFTRKWQGESEGKKNVSARGIAEEIDGEADEELVEGIEEIEEIEDPIEEAVSESFERTVDYLSRFEYAKAGANDAALFELLKEVLTDHDEGDLSPKASRTTQLIFCKYAEALDGIVGFHQRDFEEDNPSATLLIDDLLDDQGVASLVFTNKTLFRRYLLNVLAVCIRLMRMDTFRELYQRYVHPLDDMHKAPMILRFLKKHAGDISYPDEIIPFVDNFQTHYAELEKRAKAIRSLKKKRDMRRNMINYAASTIEIAMMTFTPVPWLEEVVARELKRCSRHRIRECARLASVALREDRCIETIKAWLLDLAEKEPQLYDMQVVKNVRKIIAEIETGELQERDAVVATPGTIGYLHKSFKNWNLRNYEMLAECLRLEHTYKKNLNEFEGAYAKISWLDALFKSKYHTRRQRCWADVSNALAKVPSAKESDVLYFFPGTNIQSGMFDLPLLLEAKKRGYYCAPSAPLVFNFDNCQDDELVDIVGCLYFNNYTSKLTSNRLRRKWEIDIPNERIMCGNMNMYQPIFETVSRWQFTYFYHFDTNAWARSKTYMMMRVFEKTFWQCERLADWAKRKNKKIRIVVNVPFADQFADYRIFCEAGADGADMEVIYARAGYDDYFSPSAQRSASLCAANITRHPEVRLPLFGNKEGFEAYWEREQPHLDEMRERSRTWFSAQRSKAYAEGDGADERRRAEVLERVRAHRAAGGRVYLMIGKLIFDLATKSNRGTAHRDMSHWATHVVQTLGRDPGALLLIKPHPHETRKAITMTAESTDTLRDVIRCELPDNAVYLEGHLFRNADLAPLVDVGLTWNSTSTLELAAMGVKVVMGDTWGYTDFPIGLVRLDSVEEFEDFLARPERYEAAPDIADRALAFLSYMGSEDVSVPNPYTTATATNYHVFDAQVDLGAVERFIAEGDPKIEKLFDDTF